MFAARLHDDTPNDFSRYEAAALIPKSNPFLKQLFVQISSGLEDELVWIVDDLVKMFGASDLAKIMKDYGKSTCQSDPMIHFYEDFLSAYDAGLRKDRGVWYTPLPVVKFIVRAVDYILEHDFGLQDGLANRDKVEIEVEEDAYSGKKATKKVKQTVHKVPEDIFTFYIGGYQPAQKWLKDRKGRMLTNDDCDHYQSIIFALVKTRDVMQELSGYSSKWL